MNEQGIELFDRLSLGSHSKSSPLHIQLKSSDKNKRKSTI